TPEIHARSFFSLVLIVVKQDSDLAPRFKRLATDLPIDPDVSLPQLDRLAWQTNDSLHARLRRFKALDQSKLSTARIAQLERCPIDEQPIPIHHSRTARQYTSAHGTA